MKLPNRHLAYVPEAKITRYLLDLNHPKGGNKAQVFRRRGYSDNNIDTLISDLIAVAQSQPVSSVREHRFGFNYVIYGVIQPPVGGDLPVCTVWFIPHGGDVPSLASAYPRRRVERRDP